MCAEAGEDEMRISDLLELELQVVQCGCWELNSGLPQYWQARAPSL